MFVKLKCRNYCHEYRVDTPRTPDLVLLILIYNPTPRQRPSKWSFKITTYEDKALHNVYCIELLYYDTTACPGTMYLCEWRYTRFNCPQFHIDAHVKFQFHHHLSKVWSSNRNAFVRKRERDGDRSVKFIYSQSRLCTTGLSIPVYPGSEFFGSWRVVELR